MKTSYETLELAQAEHIRKQEKVRKNPPSKTEVKQLENKVERLHNMVSTLMPPTKRSMWKNQISEKIIAIGKQIGLEGQKEVRSIYGEIYNIMRNDYGLDVNNYKSDYLRNHTDVSNAPAIDIVDDYLELKELFESIVDNYLEIKTKNE